MTNAQWPTSLRANLNDIVDGTQVSNGAENMNRNLLENQENGRKQKLGSLT